MFDGNQEAEGWGWASAARGFLLMGGLFLSPALLSLAENDAGCGDLDKGEECTGRTYGIRPSSFLTTIGAIGGFCGAILMPITGAIVDHTQYRRAVLIVTSLALIVFNYIQICISEETWFFIAILQLAGGPVFYIQSVVLLAYIPDLTDDKVLLAKYNANFDALRGISMIVAVVSVSIISRLYPGIGEIGSLKHELATARISQTFCSTMALIGFLITFLKMKPRPALSEVPQGQRLLTTSFWKIIQTASTISRHYPALWWYCVAIVLIESVLVSFLTTAITYMVDFLGMSTNGISIVFFEFLLAAIFGAKTLPYFSKKFGLLLTCKISVLAWVTLILLTAAIVRGPEQSHFMFVFACFWGYFAGSVMVNERLIYVSIMPRGQDSEMMGFYFFCGKGFVWVPPLVFTVINEWGVRTNYGMATLSVWFLLGFFALQKMGSYDLAVEHTQKMERELNQTESAENGLSQT